MCSLRCWNWDFVFGKVVDYKDFLIDFWKISNGVKYEKLKLDFDRPSTNALISVIEGNRTSFICLLKIFKLFKLFNKSK